MSAELASIITCHPQQQRGGQLCHAWPASTSFALSAGAQHGACTLPRVGALWTLVDRMTNAIPFTRLRCRTELTHPDSGCVCPMHPLKRRHKSMTNQNFRILTASADRTWKMVCHNEPGLLLKTSTVLTPTDPSFSNRYIHFIICQIMKMTYFLDPLIQIVFYFGFSRTLSTS